MEREKKIKVKCHCPCHSDDRVKHVRECCIDGYTEFAILDTDMSIKTISSDDNKEEVFNGLGDGYDPAVEFLSQKETVIHMMVKETVNKIDVFNSINTTDSITIKDFIEVLKRYEHGE